ncbi:MAG: hypothetical protein GX927_14485 [Lentisphaerae bacterium]|jgi:predicted Zn-dependent protease|nr:hypothetical protein [Lentisphaerota bacterium]
MARIGKNKKITLFFLLVLLLLCFLATTWFLVTRSYRDVEYFQQALREYQLGEIEKAKEHMRNVIRNDWNNEQAIVTLAEWFDADKEWNFSAPLWLRAASLNAFKPEYLKNAQQAFFRYRAFREAYNTFGRRKDLLDESETLQCAYAALSIGENKRAQELLDTVKSEEVLQSPLGRLLQVYLPYDKEKPKEKIVAELTALLECGDDFIVFECLVDLHFFELTHFKRTEEAIKYLEQAAEIDPLCGIPTLADLYFTAQNYEKAAETYKKNPENGIWTPALITRYAEALTLTHQSDELEKLSKKCQTGNRELLFCGYYLDALLAMLEGDMDKLLFSFEKTEGRFQSPMAQLLNLLVQIQKNNHFEIEKIARFFVADANLKEFRARADMALFPHLLKLLQDDQLANAGALARIMQKDRKPDLLLTRIDIADKAQQGTLDISDINQALRRFPEDEFLLQKNVEVYLRTDNCEKALQILQTLQKRMPDNADLDMLAIMAFSGLQKFNEADAIFADLLQKLPDNLHVLNNFLIYCNSQKRFAGLQEQIARLEQTATDPKIREYLPVFKAMMAFLQNDHLEAEKHLQGLTTDNPELQYHAAYMLGTMDCIQPAIQLYRKIPKDNSKYNLACLNLSELLTLSGEKAEALALAKNTWEKAPNWPAARECYGLRLLELGHPENAAEILDSLIGSQNATERVQEAWRSAMQQILEKQFAANQLENAQKTARRILLYWDKDPVASSYSIRIQNAILEQEKAAQEAAQQD